MSRSILNRSVLALSFCVLAMSQTANAKALTSLQSQDLNIGSTLEAKKYQAAKKEESCPFADKSDRNKVAKVAPEVVAKSSTHGDNTVR